MTIGWEYVRKMRLYSEISITETVFRITINNMNVWTEIFGALVVRQSEDRSRQCLCASEVLIAIIMLCQCVQCIDVCHHMWSSSSLSNNCNHCSTLVITSTLPNDLYFFGCLRSVTTRHTNRTSLHFQWFTTRLTTTANTLTHFQPLCRPTALTVVEVFADLLLTGGGCG